MIARRRAPMAVLVAVVLLAGCTGVPSSSSPKTVEQLPLGAQPAAQSIQPRKNAPAREVVTEFLRANAADPGKHTSARAFLTTAARNRWSDATATIITNEATGTYDRDTQTVTVTGRQVGTLDKNGIFKPSLAGDGTGGPKLTYAFRLALEGGQYRIDRLQSGLLLTSQQFIQSYQQHSLYFYDNADRYLVQDPRYSDIEDDRPQLAKWLLTQLAAGPRDELQNAVTADTLPAQADASRITVQVGAPTKVEIPGSSQLDPSGRDRLAAQLSETLTDPLSGGKITITDGGAPVSVPTVAGSTFGPDDFPTALGEPAPPPEAYYLSNDRVYTEAGVALAGPLGRPGYSLTSVALSRPDPTGPLLVAGVQGSGAGAQLLVGSQDTGLKPTSVRGALSRPAFARGRREVWVGSGTKVYRVTLSPSVGRVEAKVDPVALLDVPNAARILSVRISPDGARIALVLAAARADGGQLFIGSIVRSAGDVRVDALETISPQQAIVTDVAWLNPLRLFAIGRLSSSQDSLTFDTGVDGTDWTPRVVGLSSRPDKVTVTAGASAWVSAGGFVWVQSAGQWVSPTGGQTPGTAPVYIE